jgi:hypothetical protein
MTIECCILIFEIILYSINIFVATIFRYPYINIISPTVTNVLPDMSIIIIYRTTIYGSVARIITDVKRRNSGRVYAASP